MLANIFSLLMDLLLSTDSLQFDFDDLDKGKVQLKSNDILSLRLEVAKIVGEFV
ncbi:hypothetical protein FET70_03160 (plasmid) [Lactiplantibacillus plantarum]|nr:hypothetical protein FET70_03160 [Lactiplantibacillus plantarum]